MFALGLHNPRKEGPIVLLLPSSNILFILLSFSGKNSQSQIWDEHISPLKFPPGWCLWSLAVLCFPQRHHLPLTNIQYIIYTFHTWIMCILEHSPFLSTIASVTSYHLDLLNHLIHHKPQHSMYMGDVETQLFFFLLSFAWGKYQVRMCEYSLQNPPWNASVVLTHSLTQQDTNPRE